MDISTRNIKLWSRLGQAATYGMTLTELAGHDDKLIAAGADMLRFCALKRFEQAYPEKIVNVGIAENNLVGVSAGLSKEGFNVFAFAHAAFITARAFDFIRVNMGYMKSPIKLVGTASGFTLGVYGASHIALDDLALMRTIGGITILSPADCLETVKAVEAATTLDCPVYIRLNGLDNVPIVYYDDYEFQVGKATVLADGTDVAIVTTGAQVSRSLLTAELLERDGISCKVINMHTISPIDTNALDECLEARLIVTAEEHGLIGGLGSAVNDYLSTKLNRPQILNIGTANCYYHAANTAYLLEESGLTSEAVYNKIIGKFEE